MKRDHLPAYSPVGPQRAAVPASIVALRAKASEAAEPIARWPYHDLGSALLSFPRDLRPRSVGPEPT